MGSTESPRSSLYVDPFTTLPEAYREKSLWKSLVKVVRDLGESQREAIPPSPLRLTERNLTQYFNPEYSDEVPIEISEDYRRTLRLKQASVSKWIEGLP